MKSNKYIVFFIMLMCISANSAKAIKVSTTSIQILVPPSRIIKLPDDTKNIAIVASLHNDLINDSLRRFDSTVITSMAMDLKKHLEDTPKYSSYIFPVFKINSGSEIGAQLSKDQILELKENSDADFLISVEQFNAKQWNENKKIANNGKLYDYIHIMVEYNSIIRIYDTHDQNIVDERRYHDTLAIQIDYNSANILLANNMYSKPEVANSIVADEVAKFYVMEITPSWLEVERHYYTDSKFRSAEMYVENQEWNKAIDIWSQYVNDSKSDIAAAACFNIAFGCEMLGEYDLALEWLENVKRKNSEYYWDGYKTLIENRAKEKIIIDSIM